MPTMKSYNNWPSKDAIFKNQENYRKQRASVKRLSPTNALHKTESRFFSPPRNTSYYKDMDITELVCDPISIAVEMNREKERSITGLKATKSKSKLLLQSLQTPLVTVSGPHITLAENFYSGMHEKTPVVTRSKQKGSQPMFA